jgi:hypothetical protein
LGYGTIRTQSFRGIGEKAKKNTLERRPTQFEPSAAILSRAGSATHRTRSARTRRISIRPLLPGKPDEVLRQPNRAAVLDFKFGSYRIADPAENIQLSIYILLVSREDDAIEEVTVQILSLHFDFEERNWAACINRF